MSRKKRLISLAPVVRLNHMCLHMVETFCQSPASHPDYYVYLRSRRPKKPSVPLLERSCLFVDSSRQIRIPSEGGLSVFPRPSQGDDHVSETAAVAATTSNPKTSLSTLALVGVQRNPRPVFGTSRPTRAAFRLYASKERRSSARNA